MGIITLQMVFKLFGADELAQGERRSEDRAREREQSCKKTDVG